MQHCSMGVAFLSLQTELQQLVISKIHVCLLLGSRLIFRCCITMNLQSHQAHVGLEWGNSIEIL